MQPQYHKMKALDHPKDKMEKQNISGNRYEIPCHNCELKWNGQKIQYVTDCTSERCQKCTTGIHPVRAKVIWNIWNKSTVTDHTGKDNHVIYLEEEEAEEEGEGGWNPLLSGAIFFLILFTRYPSNLELWYFSTSWCFTSLSTFFKSYRDDGRMIIKGFVQWCAVQ